MGTLTTVTTVLGTASRLDAQERAALDVGVPPVSMMDLSRPENELGQRELVHLPKLIERLHSAFRERAR
jgi:hypothetical protein